MTHQYQDVPQAGAGNSYVADDLDQFDVRDFSGRRSMRLLLVFIGLLLLAAIVLFNVYYQGTRDRNTPPRISAQNTPYKIVPEDPGGQQTPNQDKSVYDVMKGAAVNDDVTAIPSVEVPLKMPKSANIVIEDTRKIVREPAVEAPKVKPAVSRRAAPQVSGIHVVQVASVRSQAGAQDIQNDLQPKLGALLPTGSYFDIARANVDGKGIYYRLRVEGLADQSAAKRLCQAFKSRNQACYVTRR